MSQLANAGQSDNQAGGQEATLAASREHCRRVAEERALNFYYGMKLVSEPKRSANYALYAWMRAADDLADEAGAAEAKRQALERFRADTHRAIDPGFPLPAGLLWPAVRHMVLTYRIPREYLDAMIEGQLLDQRATRYRTFDELYDYCYKVASVVGLSCIEIWGYQGGAETRKLSEYRGIAFQLTNILRDVMEDAQRDRVYLPAEDFGVFELNPVMFTLSRPQNVVEGLGKVAARARRYYEESAALEKHVHRDGRACLWAMTQIYRGLLERIERDPAVVLGPDRVRLSSFRKAMIAVRATWRGRMGR